MTTTFELWNGDIAVSMVPWAVAAGALIVALLSGERTNVWKRRYRTLAAENTALRLQLAAPRNQPSARPRPREWPEPTPPARERHWTSTLWWPGCRGGALPLEYGATPLDGSRLEDPCLRTPAPTDQALAAWLDEPQAQSWPPLTTGELRVELALTHFEALYTDTQQVETVRG